MIGGGDRGGRRAALLALAAAVVAAGAVVAAVALQAVGRPASFEGWMEWTARTFRVESGAPLAGGVDGESATFVSPLEIRIAPLSLVVRTLSGPPARRPPAPLPTRAALDELRRLAAS